MKIDRVTKGVSELVEFLKKSNYRIDEKIAICRSAADLLQQIMVTEGIIVSMRTSIESFDKDK